MDPLNRIQKVLCSVLGWKPPNSRLVEGVLEEDWAAVHDLAKTQRLLPLLHVSLSAAGLDHRLPPPIRASLQQMYYNSLLLHTRRFHRFVEILKAQADSGVSVIPLKGAFLAPVVFGNLGVRSTVDYDFLVKRVDLVKAVRVVEGLGYLPSKPYSLNWRLETYRHLPSYSKDDHHALQIHWNIVSPGGPFVVDPQGLWRRAQTTGIEGMETPTLSPEDLLLHLSIHGAYMHQFHQGLRSLCDVSEAVRHFQDVIDWHRLVSLASEWGASKCAYLVLHLAKNLLGTEIPDEVLTAMLPGTLETHIVDQATQMLFVPEAGFIRREVRFPWRRIVRSPRAAAEHLLTEVFPSRHVLAKKHRISPSGPQVLLRYPLRWIHTAFGYASRILRLSKKEPKTAPLSEQSQRDLAVLDWMRTD